MKIYKYEISIFKKTTIEVSFSGRVVHCGSQNNTPCLWILVDTDPNDFAIKRTFEIVGTGWETPDNYNYVGTYQQGEFVWHIMEVENDTN